MKQEDLIEILKLAEKLKCNTRHCVTSTGRAESVAEHSWRLSLMALLVKDEYPEVDINKLITMTIIHDLGEIFTGDIPSFLKKEADSKKEDELLMNWVSSLPEPYRSEWTDLYKEMELLETQEARLYKALDNMEAVLQHNEADIKSWLPLEYELQLNYGEDKVSFSPYMIRLKELLNEETIRKIKEGK